MERRVYIQANNKQIIGAIVARYAIESRLPKGSDVSVVILNVDEMPLFQAFHGTSYIHSPNDERTYDKDDLQSFTLTRFMPPKEMGYAGRAIVIDPDIFILTSIEELFAFDLKGSAIAACTKKDAWDTSVMLLDCAKLTHWDVEAILRDLKTKKRTYKDIMTLGDETTSITPLPRFWNDLDTYTKETKMIHMTNRLTQPWRTGLPIDFTRNPLPKYFGLIPREPVLSLLGKHPSHYQPHPNKAIEKLFADLVSETITGGALSRADIEREVNLGHVRPDIFSLVTA